MPAPRGRDPRARGRAVQRQLHPAAPAHPLRPARPRSRSRRRRPVRRPTPTRCRSSPQEHPIVETLLRYREVEKLRGTYADALPPLVHADGRIHATFNQIAHDHRAHLERGAEPAERARAHVVGPRAAQGVHRRRGLRSAHRRLLADRAPGARAPRRGPGPDRGVRTRRRHPHDHRGQGVRRRRGEGRRLPAPLRQGRQLRPRVRHGGVRARHSASTSRPTRPARSSTRTSPRSRTSPRT